MGPRENPTAIKNYLRSLGAYVINVHGSRYLIGFPDLVACYRGRFVAVEVKRKNGGRVTKVQSMTQTKIKAAGGVAIIATSVNEVRSVIESEF